MSQGTSFLDTLKPFTLASGQNIALDHATTEALHADAIAVRASATQAAEAILHKARASADKLLDDAHVEAEVLRESARQQGLLDGMQAAQDAAQAQVDIQIGEYQSALRAEVQSVIDEIAITRQALWDSQESEIIGFVLDIARQVIKTEVTQNPSVVLEVIKNALRRVTDKENIRIRVSISDAPRVREMRDDLLGVIDGLRALEIIDDRRVGDGGCVIETNAGNIDAKLETQLDEVERTLGTDSHE